MDGSGAAGCAVELEGHAGEMEAAARRIASTAGALRWESRAADAARAQVEGVVRRLTAGAGAVREAAEAVRLHGLAVEASAELLARAAAQTEQVAAAGAAALRDAVRREVVR